MSDWSGSKWLLLLWVYASFVVGNTMFSSKEDTRAFPVLIVLMIIPTVALIISGNSQLLVSHFAVPLGKMASLLNASLSLVIILNLVIAILLLALQKIVEKITRRKITFR